MRGANGALRIRLGALVERVRASLFFVPTASVVGAVLLGLLSMHVDTKLDQSAVELPFGLSSTVDSARAVLTTVAGATITFAAIAFSISLLVIQLGSSQYSPRVVHTLFRDPFNKRVMGLVIGTFAYCLIVMRSVQSALGDSADPVVPNISVSLAVLLGLVAILATVAFIDHSAHTMDISEILERVSRDAIALICSIWSEEEGEEEEEEEEEEDPDDEARPEPAPSEPGHELWFDRTGWVQQVDFEALVGCAPEGGTIVLDTFPGHYAIAGTTLCTVTPPPSDSEETERRIRVTIGIGETRTMQQDVSYGLRQLVDVALKALSPGVNDPTTAQDAIFHAAAVLGEALRRNPPPTTRHGAGERRLLLPQQHAPDQLVRLAFDEVRRAAVDQPAVCVYLLEALGKLRSSLQARRLDDRVGALDEQARLILAGCEAAGLLRDDLDLVRDAHHKWFGDRA